MSSNKPIEYDVLSKCSTLTNLNINNSTYKVSKDTTTTDENTTTGLGIPNNSFLRIAPMERKYGGWSSEHFHPDFKLNDTFLIQFQGTYIQIFTCVLHILIISCFKEWLRSA